MAEERVQRRLAAILVADVVGYSRLMEADEAGTRARLIDAMKADLTRLGIRNFNPRRLKAAERLERLRTAEGAAIPANTPAKLLRDMERLQLVVAQIKAIEAARLKRLENSPQDKSHAMVVLLGRVVGIGTETADMPVYWLDPTGAKSTVTWGLVAKPPSPTGKFPDYRGTMPVPPDAVSVGRWQCWGFILRSKNR